MAQVVGIRPVIGGLPVGQSRSLTVLEVAPASGSFASVSVYHSNGGIRWSVQPTQGAQVVQLMQDGTSMPAVARRFAVSVSVMSRERRRYQEKGQYIRSHGGGQRRSTD